MRCHMSNPLPPAPPPTPPPTAYRNAKLLRAGGAHEKPPEQGQRELLQYEAAPRHGQRHRGLRLRPKIFAGRGTDIETSFATGISARHSGRNFLVG